MLKYNHTMICEYVEVNNRIVRSIGNDKDEKERVIWMRDKMFTMENIIFF